MATGRGKARSLAGLIGGGESDTIEFKAQWNERALEDLAAFANHKGGTLLVGVTDAGSVSGFNLSVVRAARRGRWSAPTSVSSRRLEKWFLATIRTQHLAKPQALAITARQHSVTHPPSHLLRRLHKSCSQVPE
jgi:hypothetical protein